jgi:hypothetical protein
MELQNLSFRNLRQRFQLPSGTPQKPTLQLQLYEADSGLSLVNMAHDIQDETKSQGCSDINSGNTW